MGVFEFAAEHYRAWSQKSMGKRQNSGKNGKHRLRGCESPVSSATWPGPRAGQRRL